jgi:hypothetical protein
MSSIQAIIFDNKLWTATTARAWLKKNNYTPIKRVHKTLNYLRYRLIEPTKFKSFIMKKTGTGIKLVIGYK